MSSQEALAGTTNETAEIVALLRLCKLFMLLELHPQTYPRCHDRKEPKSNKEFLRLPMASRGTGF